MTADAANWVTGFQDLAELPADDRAMLVERAQVIRLPAGQTVFAPGRPAEHFLLLLQGTVKVHQVSPGGREIVLYRVSGGESCIMTTACLLSGDTYAAEGVTETEVEAVAISKEGFDTLLARAPIFRRFVFADYANRISDLMHVVEEVAFERMDKRLAHKLLALSPDGGALDITHQALAVELGSAREVVSRLMKEFVRRGWIAAGRGRIDIVDREALAAIAEAD